MKWAKLTRVMSLLKESNSLSSAEFLLFDDFISIKKRNYTICNSSLNDFVLDYLTSAAGAAAESVAVESVVAAAAASAAAIESAAF